MNNHAVIRFNVRDAILDQKPEGVILVDYPGFNLRLAKALRTAGYAGRILWDTSKPNGTPRKLLDVSKSRALGWTYRTELEEGLRLSYEDFLNNPMRAER